MTKWRWAYHGRKRLIGVHLAGRIAAQSQQLPRGGGHSSGHGSRRQHRQNKIDNIVHVFSDHGQRGRLTP